MRSFLCQCDNQLFFHSTACLNCGRKTGLCTCCRELVSVGQPGGGDLTGQVHQCSNASCGNQVSFCINANKHATCNRLIPTNAAKSSAGLCDYCELTTVIPDLSVPGNLDKWQRLEAAKHRVLYALDQIGFPFRADSGTQRSAVSFEFKEDGAEPVATGHNDGRIVINIKEADSVKREIARVQFGEPQRTLVGHFRHELGHYIWDRLVKPNGPQLEKFRNIFGDERIQDYGQALEDYYQSEPASNWQTNFISAYATMHPWEDFAETFATYIDMRSVLDTASHFGMSTSDNSNFDDMVRDYSSVGVMANELNRDMGLLDLVPEVFVPPVIEKLRFIHLLT